MGMSASSIADSADMFWQNQWSASGYTGGTVTSPKFSRVPRNSIDWSAVRPASLRPRSELAPPTCPIACTCSNMISSTGSQTPGAQRS